MIWIKTEEENMTVTRFYLEIIGQAFERLNQKVVYTSHINEIRTKPGDCVVVSTATSARHFMKRDIKLIYWAQGAWPEESYLRHSSKVRYFITSLVERTALKRANYVFFVSEPMRVHFEKKYRLPFNNYYVMPCANERFHEEAFKTPEKYEKNVFCYAGATSVWQCFEETIELYAQIERMIPNSKLLLLVKDKELALQLIEKYDIKNYEIDFVSVNQLPDRLKNVKYGFILRKPSIVNTVATPTKTLTYLANGIIPIYSESLKGIHSILKNCTYKIEISDENGLKNILKHINKPVDWAEVLKEYHCVYQEAYNEEQHIHKITGKLLEAGIVEKE